MSLRIETPKMENVTHTHNRNSATFQLDDFLIKFNKGNNRFFLNRVFHDLYSSEYFVCAELSNRYDKFFTAISYKANLFVWFRSMNEFCIAEKECRHFRTFAWKPLKKSPFRRIFSINNHFMADNLEFWADIYSRKASQGELHSKYVSIQNCFDAILQFINQFVYFVCVIPFALMHEDGNEKKNPKPKPMWMESIQLNVILFCQQFDRLFKTIDGNELAHLKRMKFSIRRKKSID